MATRVKNFGARLARQSVKACLKVDVNVEPDLVTTVGVGCKERLLLNDLSSKDSLRVYWVLGVAAGDGVAAGAGVVLKVRFRIFPIIALTNNCPVALDFCRSEVLAFHSRTLCSGRPHLIASRAYNVRGIRIDRDEVIAQMKFA